MHFRRIEVKMNNFIKILIVFHVYLLLIVSTAKVSPKLDFSEVKDLVGNSKDPVKGTRIKALKVTVDTSESRGLSESKSSSSDSSSSSGDSVEKQTVGVRTDITFEISNETNDTKTVEDKKDRERKNKENEDDNIPIFKGTAGTGTTENPNDIFAYNHEGPVFHKTNDEGKNYGQTDFDRFLPKTIIWTTERNFQKSYDVRPHYHHRGSDDQYRRRFIPYTIGQGWRPCYCEEYRPFIKPNQDPIASRNFEVDDKLDHPFKRN